MILLANMPCQGLPEEKRAPLAGLDLNIADEKNSSQTS